MASSCDIPLPEDLEKFADEHREEFQAWLKSQADRQQNDTDFGE